MKKIFLFPLVMLTSFCQAQTSQWTWVANDSNINIGAIWGPQGIEGLSYKPGGRESGTTWTDSNGDLWLFGGLGYMSGGNQGYLNDLWRYRFSTGKWTWKRGYNTINGPGAYGNFGIYGPDNTPSSKSGSVSWKDASGRFWLFGGYGYGTSNVLGYLNDLWLYDPSVNQWAWMKGWSGINGPGADYGTQGVAALTNTPGPRQGSCNWKALDGTLWLFGGLDDVGYLNDLWKYDIATNQWTWMKGDNTWTNSASYGTMGVTSSSNKPGPRIGAKTWTDNNGNFWMFGGYGYVAPASFGYLNDLWKYNVSANQWTWINGSNVVNEYGVYGILGTSSATNKPGARKGATTWKDIDGNFLMFGGYGRTSSSIGDMNDMWKYDIATNQWTWVNGDSSIEILSVYGMKGVTAPTNKPGARDFSFVWTDNINTLWMLGGSGRGFTTVGNVYSTGGLNDLWKYEISFPTGINNIILVNDKFQVFPNPAKDEFYIKKTVQETASRKYSYHLTDSYERPILQRSEVSNTQTFDIKTLYPGIYFITIYEGNKKLAVKKILKL